MDPRKLGTFRGSVLMDHSFRWSTSCVPKVRVAQRLVFCVQYVLVDMEVLLTVICVWPRRPIGDGERVRLVLLGELVCSALQFW